MFEESIKEGKPQPSFAGTDDFQVALTVQGEIQNPEFLRFIEKIGRERLSSFTTEDLLVLDAIQRDEPIVDTLRSRLIPLANEGIIERNVEDGSVYQVLPSLTRHQIQKLLQELKSEGKIRVGGVRRYARWYPIGNVL